MCQRLTNDWWWLGSLDLDPGEGHKWRDNRTSPNLRDEVKELHACNCVSKAVTVCPGNQWAILMALSLITL